MESNFHDLKLTIQQHFTDGMVTVIGSGLSCAEGLPGMGELACHLDTVLATGLGSSDTKKWRAISQLIPLKGLESALIEIPPTPTLEVAIVATTADLIATRERKIIGEVFSRTRTLRFTRILEHLLKPPTGLPIVTTNYDRLVEVAIEEAALGVDTLFVGHFAGRLNEAESRLSFCKEVTLVSKKVHYRYRTRANVFKPHGSLDWYHRDGAPVRYSGDLDLPRLIITPGLNKFRNGYESPFDRHRERANSAIDRASRFLIIGYGFNDDHLETHLTPRIRSGIPTLLLTHSLSANAAKLALDCPNVIAIQFGSQNGIDGSAVTISRLQTFIPDLNLWDLGEFTTNIFNT